MLLLKVPVLKYSPHYQVGFHIQVLFTEVGLLKGMTFLSTFGRIQCKSYIRTAICLFKVLCALTVSVQCFSDIVCLKRVTPGG